MCRPQGRRKEDDMARIAVPFDGSAESERLLEVACRAASANGDEVHAVYVIRVSRHLPMTADLPQERAHAAELFERAQEIADRYGTCLITVTVQARDVGRAIVEAARGCDTIMLELRSRRRFYERGRLNRTLRYIMTHASCQVLISYPPATDDVLATAQQPSLLRPANT
jgi:nucleotide-binding universal stress UspA family protein